MVTKAHDLRLPMVRRSLADYCRQTHAHRELVIVVDAEAEADGDAVRAAVAELGRADIRVVVPEAKHSLGALRNISWQEASGDIVCQWDDDDLNHPRRIELQLAALRASGKSACYLQEFVQYFPMARCLYKLSFLMTPGTVAMMTLMCLRSLPVRYPEAGPDSIRGEDRALALEIKHTVGFHALAGMPHLYVYVSHGANTMDDAHHRMLADELGVSQGLLRRYEAALREGLASFDFGPEAVEFMGRNGVAFTIPGRGR
jgi:glycosyltransferase involved in cell wall biosynthesis